MQAKNIPSLAELNSLSISIENNSYFDQMVLPNWKASPKSLGLIFLWACSFIIFIYNIIFIIIFIILYLLYYIYYITALLLLLKNQKQQKHGPHMYSNSDASNYAWSILHIVAAWRESPENQKATQERAAIRELQLAGAIRWDNLPSSPTQNNHGLPV